MEPPKEAQKQPEDAGNPTEQNKTDVHKRVQEGQEKAERHGVEPGPPEPKTI